jgi:hypothetical protein
MASEPHDEARSRAHEAFAMAGGVHYDVAVAWALQHLAAVAILQTDGDRGRPARPLGYVDERLVTLEARRECTEQREYDAIRAKLGEALGEDELEALMSEGRAWREEQAVAEALALEPRYTMSSG